MLTERSKTIGRIADQLVGRPVSHPLRVAVDGITAAGKTTVALELCAAVRERGRPAIHLSMDGFHHPRAHRYRQGRDSAAGYYTDAYDFAAFAAAVLHPLGPTGDRRYRAAVLDLASDQPVAEPPVLATADAVLVVDGSFLQKPALAELWDEVVFVAASFEQARSRGTHRDAEAFGGQQAAEQAYQQRYHAAGRRYLAEVAAADRATVVLDNGDVTRPVLRRIGGPAGSSVQLFCFGTLQQADVQRSTFGRLLHGTADQLVGYRTDSVPGTVYSLDTAELAAADRCEVDDHRRRFLRLASGTPAWAYLTH